MKSIGKTPSPTFKRASKMQVTFVRKFLVFALLTLMGDDAFAQKTFSENAIKQLDAAFASVSGQKHVVNCVALVDANGGSVQWNRASGLADPKTGEAMTTEHLFRTASVTKSFTGVLVMQLIEQGEFELDTPIGGLLPKDAIPKGRQLNDLHVQDGISSGEQITVRQLLNHTSGLADYWFDEGMYGGWNGRTWLDVMTAEMLGEIPETFDPPTRLWDPKEIIDFFFQVGLNQRAHFAPGKDFLYSDTNYLLLGMIIENTTGHSLASIYRTRIYEPLGLKRIFKEHREPAPADFQFAHHFTWIRGKNIDIVETQAASTGEWANGGQVTSASDLRTFIRGVFAGKLFSQPKTLNIMLNAALQDLDGPQKYFSNGDSTYQRYTCGWKRWNVEGTTIWGHTGFWGVGMFYIPDADVSIVLVSNQVETNVEQDMETFVKALKTSDLSRSP